MSSREAAEPTDRNIEKNKKKTSNRKISRNANPGATSIDPAAEWQRAFGRTQRHDERQEDRRLMLLVQTALVQQQQQQQRAAGRLLLTALLVGCSAAVASRKTKPAAPDSRCASLSSHCEQIAQQRHLSHLLLRPLAAAPRSAVVSHPTSSDPRRLLHSTRRSRSRDLTCRDLHRRRMQPARVWPHTRARRPAAFDSHDHRGPSSW